MVENDGSILGADVIPLPVQCGWAEYLKEDLHQLLKTDLLRIRR